MNNLYEVQKKTADGVVGVDVVDKDIVSALSKIELKDGEQILSVTLKQEGIVI